MQEKRKVRGPGSGVLSQEESNVQGLASSARSQEDSAVGSPQSAVHSQEERKIRNPQSASGNAEDWLAGDPNTIAASRVEHRPAVARVRVCYSKLAEARFVGAKETATLFARATRRARLPVAYSQGVHPLPRLRFRPALPL